MRKQLLSSIIFFIISSSGFAEMPTQLKEKYGLLSATQDKVKNSVSKKSQLSARGVIQAQFQATLASGLEAQISQFKFRQGMKFNEGETLVKFDCRKPEAEIRKIQTGIKIHEQKVAMNEEMAKFDSISDYELKLSRIELSQAKAEQDAKQIELEACQIKAPYEGRVVETFVNQYEVVGKNEPLLSIVNTSVLEAVIIIPSQWLVWLQRGTTIYFFIDELKQSLKAEVSYISPVVDPVSKTVNITAEFENGSIAELNILPGMSGTARFTSKQEASL
ncbi:efflux RND transporter periplasmic adaptor subunit [Marinomonas epiphytica]